jgi:hypothetical protein
MLKSVNAEVNIPWQTMVFRGVEDPTENQEGQDDQLRGNSI